MRLIQYPLPKDLQVLLAVVDAGSLAAAAEKLGQTPAFVTKRIQQLESCLGIKLLNRSAHGLALTESGKLTCDHAMNVLEQLQILVDEVTLSREQPAGMIRIGCSFGFGRTCIAPAIIALMEQYPDLHIHFELFDRQVDLVKDNIDLDIRVNDDIPDHYIARLLTHNQRILCASPDYLQQRGRPTTLAELHQHDCLITKERDMSQGIWELEDKQGKKKTIKISGHLSSNSGEIVLHWALQGKGIMLRSVWDVNPFLTSGELVHILPDYAQSANIWAVYKTPLYSSARLRACVEYFTRYCQHPFFLTDMAKDI